MKKAEQSARLKRIVENEARLKRIVENELREAIKYYEMCQATEGCMDELSWDWFQDIVNCLKQLNLECNTKNLASYGHKRSAYYLAKYPELGE